MSHESKRKKKKKKKKLMMMMNVRDMIESKKNIRLELRWLDVEICPSVKGLPHFLKYSAFSDDSYFIHINSRYTGCTDVVIAHSNYHRSNTA